MTSIKTTQSDPNSPDFDYCEWIQTEPTKDEFLKVWQQFNEKEKEAILADYYFWLTANS